MNRESVVQALLFFPVIKDGIVLQCLRYHDVPYIKRTIREVLGQPDKGIDNRLWYNGKFISIVPVERDQDMRGYRDDQLFYIGWNNPDEENKVLSKLGIQGWD